MSNEQIDKDLVVEWPRVSMNFICVGSHLREFDTYLCIRVGRELSRLTRSGRRGADYIDVFHPFSSVLAL
jgi:hypothetical protein